MTLSLLLYIVTHILQVQESVEMRLENSNRNCSNNYQIDESTSYYSSSYSSFLKTDAGSGSNDDSCLPENRSTKTDYVRVKIQIIVK